MRVRVPSIKTLQSIPWLDKLHTNPEDAAGQARKIMKESAEDGSNYLITGYRVSAARAVLEKLDKLFETHGVEMVDNRFLYLNTGDTYTTTIVFYIATRAWRVTSWGAVVEADEKKGVKYP